MKKNILKTTIAAVCLYSSSSMAASSFIDMGNYTIDTNTGLAWLDVTLTMNMSYETVTSLLRGGRSLGGWSYASSYQLITMVNNFTGSSLDPSNMHPLNRYSFPDGRVLNGKYVDGGPIDDLIELLGDTKNTYYLNQVGKTYNELVGYPEGARTTVHGILGDQFWEKSRGEYWNAYALLDDFDTQKWTFNELDIFVPYEGLISPLATPEEFGSFLVIKAEKLTNPTAPVPLPAAVWMFMPAVLGLFATGRRKKSNVIK